MNKKEVITKVREHFSQPGVRYGRPEHEDPNVAMCMYRGNSDATSPIRCAFGVLIPDDLYSPDMEGTTSDGVLSHWPAVADLFDLDLREQDTIYDPSFLSRLQQVHDDAARQVLPIDEFLINLDEFEHQEIT